MTCSGIMHGRNIQKWFYLHTHIGRMSSTNMVNISLADSSPILTPSSTSNMISLPTSSSMGTKISPSQTSMNYPLFPLKFSYHKANEGDLGETLQAPVKVPDMERIKGNILGVHQNTPYVEISTNPPDASSQTATSSISVPIVHQAVTPSVIALKKQKRKCMSKTHEFEDRGKRPQYMHFIFRKGDIEWTPSATYTESAPAVPQVPISDYWYTDITDTIESYPHLFKVVTPIIAD